MFVYFENLYKVNDFPKKKLSKMYNKINKSDVIIILCLFMLAFLTKIPTLSYPIMGDSKEYAELTENIVYNHTYSTPIYSGGNVPHDKRPPLYPLSSSIFLILSKNVVLSLKLSTILWSSLAIALVYLFSRKIKFNRFESTIISLLVLFNPWFFYFMGVLALTEGLAVFLIMLGMFMFMFRKSSICYSISGLSFGLAVLTRYPSALFLFPFLIYCFIMILKKENIRGTLIFALLSTLPIIIWLMRNFLTFNRFLPGGYMRDLASLDNYSLFYFILNLAKQLFIITPVTLMILFPFAIIGIIIIFKEKKLIWKLFLIGCCINYLFFSWCYVVGITVMLKYIMLTIPLLIVLSIKGLFSIKRINYNTKKIIMILTLVVFIFAAMFINYGFFKDKTDNIIKLRPIYAQKSYHRAQAINWINTNVPENSIIISRFDDVDLRVGINQYIPSLLRIDLEYAIIETDFEPHIKEYSLSYHLKENKDYLNQKEVYFISELNAVESQKAITKETKQSFALEERFKSKQEPFVYIYRILLENNLRGN